MKFRLKGKAGAALLIIVFGLVKIPIEHSIEGTLREHQFRAGDLDLSMREQLGQGAFVAALGGFRSLIASGYYIKAHTAFEATEWGKVEKDYGLITQLQPRSRHYWDVGHWHMAFNAYAYYLRQKDEARSEGERLRWGSEAEYYRERGRQFLEDGIRYLPDEWRLYRLMGDLMDRKYDDKCKAADWYLEGSKKPNARGLMYRLYLYMVSECEGREREAYDALLAAHLEGAQTPSVILNLQKLEDAFADAMIAEHNPAELATAAAENAETGHFEVAVLGRYYERVAQVPARAAAIYGQLARSPEAPSFYQMKWGLELAKIPGREAEALQVLRAFLENRLRGVYADAEEAVRRLEGDEVPAPGRAR